MKTLIKQTLANRFNLDNFTPFIKNFFNEIEINPQEINVAKGFEEYIKKFLFLGEFSDVEKKNIDVLAVELSGDSKVERARSFQRNLIAKYLKDNFKDAGLVAFYSKDNPDWRLSFVKMDYKLSDKGAKVEVGTPPKRYSFLIGETEPSHTAQKQLLPILEDHKNNPLISEIEEAFSVEKVTKEFYEKYRSLFEGLAKDLKKNRSFQIIASKENIDIENFAKKLLGQVVFLYFLQKKGWLGVPLDKTWGQGDKFFLRTLFEKAKKEKKNFYDSYLEPLFYNTLNNPRRDEVDPAYSRYFDCKIPFLNGGLFEPDYDWKNTIVFLENDIFEDIVETFNLYNFTVKEDEPLEKEVAVDPEMLGKVFENLLPENLRKGQGTYYTPREIVHYMCQESLINYLATETKIEIERIRKLVTFKDSIITKEDYFESINNSDVKHKIAEKILTLWENEIGLLDKALVNIKVCDPACGSGAFLVGMLNEIVGARRILGRGSEYKLKKETIQNSIYGVDIDPGAVEIAKLRLWLSLVVDYELRDIEPLPNLDYKIMCGNSLLEELIIGDESIKLFDERLLNLPKSNKQKNGLFDEEDFEGRSGAAKNEYLQNLLKTKQKELLELHSKNQLTQEKKQELEQEIDALNKELNPKSKKIKRLDIHPSLFGDKAERFFNILKELHKQYFTEYDPIKKKEKRKQIEDIEIEFIKSSIKEKVDGIEDIIRNLNMQDPGDRKQQAVLMKKKLEYLGIPEQIHNSKTRPYFLWKLNFFEVFQEKGGFDAVIANPPYISYGLRGAQKMEENYKNMLRNLFPNSAEYKISMYAIFMDRALQLCGVNGFQSLIVPDSFLLGRYFSKIRRIILHKNKIIEILLLPYAVFDATVGFSVVYLFQRNGGNRITDHKIITKLAINNAEISSHSFRSFSYKQSYFEKLKHNRFRLFFDQKTLDLITKIELNTVELGEHFTGRTGVRSLVGQKNIIGKEKKSKTWQKGIVSGGQVLKYKIVYESDYINIDPEKLNKGGWDYDVIHATKILIRQTSDNLTAALDTDQYYHLNNVHSFAPDDNQLDIKFILALLNSRLLNYYYKMISLEKGRAMAQTDIETLESLPVKMLSGDNQKPFVQIVERIMSIMKEGDYLQSQIKQAKVNEYEKQLNSLVYKLYQLSPEETKLIEDFNKA